MSKFSAFICAGPEEQFFVLAQLSFTELFVVCLGIFPPNALFFLCSQRSLLSYNLFF